MRNHNHRLRRALELKNHRLQPLDNVHVALSPTDHTIAHHPLRIAVIELVLLSLLRHIGVLLAHLLVGQVLADARIDLVQRRPLHTAVALDVLGRLHRPLQATRPHR